MNTLQIKGNMTFDSSYLVGSFEFSNRETLIIISRKDKTTFIVPKGKKLDEFYKCIDQWPSEYKWSEEEYSRLVENVAQLILLSMLRCEKIIQKT